MQNLVANITSLTNDADGIAVAQTLADAEAMVVGGALASGGVATMATAQKVSIASVGDDTGITFTVTGTDPDSTAIVEVITGGNAGTVTSAAYFKTVSSIVTSGASAADVTVGVLTANGGVSKSLRVNGEQPDFKLGLYYDLTGAMTATVQYTPDQPEDTYATSFATDAAWWPTASMAAVTADTAGNIFYKVNAVRLQITAYTSGSSKLTVTQSY